ARVGEQSHLAGVLHSLGDLALFLDGDTGDPTGADLAAVGDELAQQRGVLVVDRPLKVEALERVGLLLDDRLANLSLGHSGTPSNDAPCRVRTGDGCSRRAARRRSRSHPWPMGRPPGRSFL